MWRLAVAIVLLVGCERERALDNRPPVRRDARGPADAAPFRIRYAARTDNAPDGSNRTYFSIVEDESLFIVAEAPNELTAPRVATVIGDLAPTTCKHADDRTHLRCMVRGAHDDLVARGQTATVTVVMIRGEEALVMRAGDAPVLRRDPTSARTTLIAERTEKLGSAAWSPEVTTLDLRRGDVLLLANRNVVDAAEVSARDAALDQLAGLQAQMKEALERFGSHLRGRATRTQDFTMIGLYIP